MIEDLFKRMRNLNLLHTDVEADDWCTEVDKVLQEAADVMECLEGALHEIQANAGLALKGRSN